MKEEMTDTEFLKMIIPRCLMFKSNEPYEVTLGCLMWMAILTSSTAIILFTVIKIFG